MGYISFPRIGFSGNLASQISQYASLYAIAKNNDLDIVFPESSVYDGWGHKFSTLLDLKLNYISDGYFADLPLPFLKISNRYTCKWENLSVDEEFTGLDKNKNYWINDIFNNSSAFHSKYHKDIMSWKWNENKYNIAKSHYDKIKVDGKELVSIHVRRGDYLSPYHAHFCILDTDYYTKALSHFTKDIDRYHFIVFSNDIDWCKENLIEGDRVTFIDPSGPDLNYSERLLLPVDIQDDCTDLILMSMCDHQIIANSSYSWWAAYKNKNPNKIVVCPENYVKRNSIVASQMNGKYYLPEWIPIKNSDIV